MNIVHLKYAVEVAKCGSISKAAENLFTAQPNLSRAIKDLESNLGIGIFYRSSKGMVLTPEGETFIGYAKKILQQIDDVENMYKSNLQLRQHFSISVPRASYISDGFVNFTRYITGDSAEVFYHETDNSKVLANILNSDYHLGIIRYAAIYDSYFKKMFEEKGLVSELIASFHYRIAVSKDSALAKRTIVHFDDLKDLIEIAHADSYVPNLSLSDPKREELPDNIERKIVVFDRGSQFDLLAKNTETFMWVSPLSKEILDRYNLVQIDCPDNHREYKDVLIYKKGYKMTDLDKNFITQLCYSKKNTFSEE